MQDVIYVFLRTAKYEATVTFEFDVDKGFARVSDENRVIFDVKMKNPAPCGISYLIIQCMPDGESNGAYIRKLEMKAE